jgi:uroporphyrin-III C-methyltransferase/precorrin-2 dehydrogenase/sirohydrochlorin ferrochelatase
MRHYPVFLDLVGRRALVLGSGEVAHRKAAVLAEAGAEIVMRDTFDPADLAGCAIAIGADAAEPELVALSAAARAAGIPVNCVDRPALCSFISPSVIDRDPITIAVSTSGTAPVLARLLRQRIEALIPPAYGRLAAMAGRLTAELRRRMPDMGLRRRVLERVFTGRVADLVFAGREAEAEAAFAEEIAAGESRPATGFVHLVGGGPGSGDLLTLRAQRILGEADVIVHDRLVGEDVLAMARRDAERIYVGKARANHCLPQEGINDLLIRLAREGRRVVRLKGGDPFVFGRGGEEAEALAAAGIGHEIVPGITAALACAAQFHIPLTHRDAARAVTFVTGHTRDGKLDLDFPTLARSGATIVAYMAGVTVAQLRDNLVAEGMSPEMPAAVIANGGRPEATIRRGPLADLPSLVAGHPAGPALVMIGEVVGRGEPETVEPEMAECSGAPVR